MHFIDQAIAQGMTHPSAYTILGNLRFATGDRTAAITAYQQAIARDGKHVPALFNISRVYFSQTEHQKAGEAHRAATTVDYDLVETFDREAKQRGPTYMAPDDVPRSVFAATNAAAPQIAAAAHDVWRELSGRTIARWYVLSALAICMLIALGGFFKKTTATPTNLTSKPAGDAKASVEPLQRIRHEIEVHRHSVRLLRMRRVLSVFLAGAGQLLVGRALSGLAFLVVFLTSTIMLLIALDILPSPVPLAGGPSLLALVAYLGTASVAYLISLVNSQREDV
jgi:hypothetical protein